jgi:HD superfamily phosphodiesterase
MSEGTFLLREEQLHQISAFVKQHLHETVSSSDQEWVQRFPRAAEHRWQHTLNVLQNAEKIIAGDGISQEAAHAARAASIMHDVSIFECDHAVHGQIGAETAEKYLSEQQHDPDFIARVVRAIVEHGTDFDTLSPQEMGKQFSLEGKILIEADILDKLGAAAVSNAMLILGKQERLGHECHALLSDGLAMQRAVYFKDYVWSETARRMAGERFAFFLKFLDQLADEVMAGTE